MAGRAKILRGKDPKECNGPFPHPELEPLLDERARPHASHGG